jgi:hypothetical protein
MAIACLEAGYLYIFLFLIQIWFMIAIPGKVLRIDSFLITPLLEENMKHYFPHTSILLGMIEAGPVNLRNLFAIIMRIAAHNALRLAGVDNHSDAVLLHGFINLVITFTYSEMSLKLRYLLICAVRDALSLMTVYYHLLPYYDSSLLLFGVMIGCTITTLLSVNLVNTATAPGLCGARFTKRKESMYLYGYGRIKDNLYLKKRRAGKGVNVAMTRKNMTKVEIFRPQIPEGLVDSRSYGVVPPHPTTNSPITLVEGYVGRLCSEEPEVDPGVFDELRRFVETEFLPRIVPFEEDSLHSISDYLKHLNPTKRKKYAKAFLKLVDSNDSARMKLLSKLSEHGAFVKSEFYEIATDPRAIYTPDDLAKCIFGWMFSMIEKQVYAWPEVVKNIPVADRGAYIKKRLNQYKLYLETDFTSLEGSISRRWMEQIEHIVYKKFFSNCSKETQELVTALLKLQSGKVVTRTRYFSTSRIAGRHSGDMNTSLGNLITNIILISFVFKKAGIDFIGVFEGDDGLINADGVPDLDLLHKLGFKLKFDWAPTIGELSFCGMKFSEAGQSMTNPFMLISKLTFIPKQYCQAKQKTIDKLIFLKCISCLFEHPNCPMSSAYAQVMLLELGVKISRSTMRKFVSKMQTDEFTKNRYLQTIDSFDFSIKPKIDSSTRLLFFHTYGVSPEAQLLFEADPASELSKKLFLQFCPVEWKYNTKTNTSPHKRGGFELEIIKEGIYKKNETLDDIVYVETEKLDDKETKEKRGHVRLILSHRCTGPSLINVNDIRNLI